jgi:hypothetical protein
MWWEDRVATLRLPGGTADGLGSVSTAKRPDGYCGQVYIMRRDGGRGSWEEGSLEKMLKMASGDVYIRSNRRNDGSPAIDVLSVP